MLTTIMYLVSPTQHFNKHTSYKEMYFVPKNLVSPFFYHVYLVPLPQH